MWMSKIGNVPSSERCIVKGGLSVGKAIGTNIRYQRCLQRTSCDPDKETASKDGVGDQNCRGQVLGCIKEKGETGGDSCQASGGMSAGTVHQGSFGSNWQDGSAEH